MFVNDVHSRLNETPVAHCVGVGSLPVLRATIQQAARRRLPISVSGSRHAMGGQQFVRDGWMLDMRPMRRVLSLDRDRGLVTVEAGIEWPALIAALDRLQPDHAPRTPTRRDSPAARASSARASSGGPSSGRPLSGRPSSGGSSPWTIVQKQTGADRLTLGGALASNIHGRGLRLPPIVSDVESFLLVDADGRDRCCSRTENPALFRAAIGGYGLLGVIAEVTLRLQRRTPVVRRVEIRDAHGLIDAFARRQAEGCEYGDFQFATDGTRDTFLRTGVFSCYQRLEGEQAHGPLPAKQRRLSPADWRRLAHLAHADKGRAFETYAAHYLSTDGQRYWSDTHQLAFYEADYHRHLDGLPGVTPGTEMITELYVPRPALDAFLEEARTFLRAQAADLIYGTIRLIARDDETLLAWAREPWACVVFNLHVTHTPPAIARAADTFRGLIDLAIAHEGSYYLTYHRWATLTQLRRCHPTFDDFITFKRRVDPEERFQSDWYRHYSPGRCVDNDQSRVSYSVDGV